MEKAGYSQEQIEEIVHALLWEVEVHEQVISFDAAKELGINVKHYNEEQKYTETWKIMKQWLNKYFLKPSPVHFIKYCIPTPKTEPPSIDVNKEDKPNNT